MLSTTLRPCGRDGFSATGSEPHCASTPGAPSCEGSVQGVNAMLPSMRGSAGGAALAGAVATAVLLAGVSCADASRA